jgi:restriction system-associated AAA family ATPase
MKLLRLKINQKEGFRSLQEGFEMSFLQGEDWSKATVFNPYVLAGKNGSGKSNVLEALSEIFYHLDCIYLSNKPDFFDEEITGNNESFDSEISRVNEYEIEYLTFVDHKTFPEIDNEIIKGKEAHIRIIKEKGTQPTVKWVNKKDFKVYGDLSSYQVKDLLPEYVVAYASGGNEVLSLPFFKSRFIQYDNYYNNLITGNIVDPSPESSLIYIDKSYSQVVLLTNLLMLDHDDTTHILAPFREYVGIEDIDSFRIVIKTDIVKEFEGNEFPLLRNLDFELNQEGKHSSSFISKLKNCATTWYTEENSGWIDESLDSNLLILDYKVNKATKEAFQFHFENDPLKLFELFQLLLILDIYAVNEDSKNNTYATQNIFLSDSINFRPIESKRVFNIKDFKIKKRDVTKSIYTKALSDGEHQFLHSLGLCLLFKDTRSLFLLDEPETHFNPTWKAKFLSSLRNCFSKEKKDKDLTMREMLISTHSPYLLSDSDSKYVQVFKKDAAPLHPEFQTFGTSVNTIGIKIFEMPNTIGEVAQDRIKTFKDDLESIESRENLEAFVLKVKSEIGDSVERLLLLNEAYNKLNPSE